MQKGTKTEKTRKVYSDEIKARCKRLYLRGLTLKEISEFLKISIRTLEFWQSVEKWTLDKETNPILETVYNLHQNGKTIKEIAVTFDVSMKTVSNYLAKYRKMLANSN